VNATPTLGPELRKTGVLPSLQSLLLTVVIAIFVITFLVQAFQIPSESMEDTLLIGDYLLVDKVHFSAGGFWGHLLPYSDIHRGEIVVFHYPVDPHQHFVKRVIGVPGDRVRMAGKQVWVNGVAAQEPYVIYKSPDQDAYHSRFPNSSLVALGVEGTWWKQMPGFEIHGELLVPPGQYFVLGDNRDQSYDSRYWGFVPRDNIIGRPLLIYWSVSAPQVGTAVSMSPSDKLGRFAYVLTHVLNATRWDRTFRLVR